jgi:hypothetical protein
MSRIWKYITDLLHSSYSLINLNIDSINTTNMSNTNSTITVVVGMSFITLYTIMSKRENTINENTKMLCGIINENTKIINKAMDENSKLIQHILTTSDTSTKDVVPS